MDQLRSLSLLIQIKIHFIYARFRNKISKLSSGVVTSIPANYPFWMVNFNLDEDVQISALGSLAYQD
jgi:hypothetical protein